MHQNNHFVQIVTVLDFFPNGHAFMKASIPFVIFLFLMFRNDFSSEMFAGWQIPILVIGTKVDLAKSLRDNILCRKSTVAEECGAAEMNIVSK